MPVPAFRGPLSFDEPDGSAVVLNETSLGFDPASLFSRLLMQASDLGAGTWSLDVFGPAGAFTEVAAGLGASDFLVIGGGIVGWCSDASAIPGARFHAYRVRFVGTGGGATIYVEAQG